MLPYSDILECDNPQEFLDAVTTIIKMMDVEWFFYSRGSEKYQYSAQQGWIPRKKQKRESGSRVYNATCELGEIGGLIEEFQGALSYDDIVHKFTIPQLLIMRMDKPSVDFDSEEEPKQANTAEDLLALLSNRKK